MTLRRFEALLRGLPLESLVARELGAHKPGDWSNTDELLAAAIYEHRLANFYFVKANAKRGTHVPEPKPIRRPDGAARQNRPRPASAEELAAKLGMSGGVVTYTPKAKG